MEFITNVFTYIPSMPLFNFVAGSYAFSFLFYIFYKMVGVCK